MAAPVVALEGDLRVISLFDLVQLLRLNGATGCLAIADGDRKGALYFDGGELINALDERSDQGEEAAIGLFAWRTGVFEFRAEAPVGGHVIESGTEAVMMEAARRLDENAVGSVERIDDSETRRLQEHQAAMEALRDAFRRVAGEANERHPAVDALAVTVHLYELTEPEDRLLYRPGHPPQMRRRGRWSPVPEPALARADFDQLRRRLADACDPIQPAGSDATSRRMTLANGRVLLVEAIGEAGGEESLWVRLAGAAPLDTSRILSGDLDMLSTLIGLPESLLILGAGEPATARRLLGATAGLAMGPADTVILVSNDGGGAIRTPTGISLATTPARLRPLLATVRPDIVALDPDLGPGVLALEDLATVRRVLAAVVGHDAASLPARWLFRLTCRRPAAGSAWLATMLRGVVTARRSDTEPGALAVSAWLLDALERELALKGDIEALGDRLDARATG
ncbi:MAG: DUF4388 domain-containing protein [Candidatus Eiseniibacteriota bacterium]